MEMKKYKLGELMDVTRGQSLSGEYYSKSGNLVRLTLGNFDYHNNCFKDDKSKDNLYFTGSVKKEFILKKDDIITPLTEQAIGLLGSTAKIPCSGKYIQSQDVALIKCNKKLNPDFAFYLIPSKIVRNQLSAAAQQTKIRHTSPDKIKDCSVWVPEYSEQEKIGKLLSRIDNKIAINRQINRNLEELAKQIYDYWFVQFDFPNEEGMPYKSSGGKMVWNETLKREIPDGWEVKNLGEVCNFRNGINYDKKVIGNKTYKIVNVRNISASSLFLNQNEFDIISLKSNQADNYLVSENSILIARSGCPGATRIIMNVDTNVIFCGFIICMENFHSDYKLYFAYCLKALENTSATTTGGSILQNVSQDTLKRISVIIPPNDIITAYNEKTLAIFKSQLSIQKEIEELSKLRDNLLPLLMNGQVTLNSCLSHD